MEALAQRKLSLVAIFLWRGLKFERGYGPLFPPPMDGGASEISCRRRTNLKEVNQKSDFLEVITTYMLMAYNPQSIDIKRSTVLR